MTRILVIAIACAAVVAVDDTFQISNASDRERLLDYVHDNSELDANDAILTVIAPEAHLPVLLDTDGGTIEPEELDLPPREEIDADVEDVMVGDTGHVDT